MLFLAVSCLLFLSGDLVARETYATRNNSTILVETLRRQLMTNNYDYLPSESEDRFPIVLRARDDADDNTGEPSPDYDSINKFKDKNLTRNDLVIPRAQEYVGNYNNQPRKGDAVSKSDLLYYIDDEKLRKEQEPASYNISDVSFYSDIYDGYNDTNQPKSPKVKYKMLKVKDAHPSRRSLSFRSFIKEESADGIALTNLDEQPFPQFRLPPERRQYMHDAQDNDSGQGETAPPA